MQPSGQLNDHGEDTVIVPTSTSQTCQSLCVQTRTASAEVPAGPMAIHSSHVSVPGLCNFPFNLYNTVGFPCNPCSGEETEAGTIAMSAAAS